MLLLLQPFNDTSFDSIREEQLHIEMGEWRKLVSDTLLGSGWEIN